MWKNRFFFRHVEGEERPSKKFASLKASTQFGCVSQDFYPRKSILRGEGK